MGYIDSQFIYLVEFLFNLVLLEKWVVEVVVLLIFGGVFVGWVYIVGKGDMVLVVDNGSKVGWVKNCWVEILVVE